MERGKELWREDKESNSNWLDNWGLSLVFSMVLTALLVWMAQ